MPPGPAQGQPLPRLFSLSPLLPTALLEMWLSPAYLPFLPPVLFCSALLPLGDAGDRLQSTSHLVSMCASLSLLLCDTVT